MWYGFCHNPEKQRRLKRPRAKCNPRYGALGKVLHDGTGRNCHKMKAGHNLFVWFGLVSGFGFLRLGLSFYEFLDVLECSR